MRCNYVQSLFSSSNWKAITHTCIHREGGKERDFPSTLYPNAIVAKAGPGSDQEPRVPSRMPTWVAPAPALICCLSNWTSSKLDQKLSIWDSTWHSDNGCGAARCSFITLSQCLPPLSWYLKHYTHYLKVRQKAQRKWQWFWWKAFWNPRIVSSSDAFSVNFFKTYDKFKYLINLNAVLVCCTYIYLHPRFLGDKLHLTSSFRQ